MPAVRPQWYRGQLGVADLFCSTGHIAAGSPISTDFFRHDGAWYDTNDIGGDLLMLPAACASVLHGAHDPKTLAALTTIAKGGASLTFALIGGVGLVFVFLSLTMVTTIYRAWWWALAFLFGTAFMAYVKAAWDVLPAATGIAALTYIALRKPGWRGLYAAAVGIAFASLARYT